MKAFNFILLLGLLLSSVVHAQTVIKQTDAQASIVQLGSVGVKTQYLQAGQTTVVCNGCTLNAPVSGSFAGQVVVSHTVSAGNVYYLGGLSVGALVSGMTLTTNLDLANYYLESPVGTIILTGHLTGVSGVTKPEIYHFDEPAFFSAGSLIRVVCIPATTGAKVECNANLFGYER